MLRNDPDAFGHEPPEQPETRYLFRQGGSFVLDESDRPTAVWGRDSAIMAAEGEATVLAGVQGTGKSTIAQQFALGRAGFSEYADLLDMPILPGQGRVLYLAMDRPRQIARSFRRMVGEAWRDELNDKLAVWAGPPPRDLAKHPAVLASMAEEAAADTVIVDSLKDAAVGLTDDEVGAGWNRARQMCLREGVELLELHHGRKSVTGTNRCNLTIDDVYGSTWITAGAGSVILLTGEPGDPIVQAHHVKQPQDEAGPFRLLHDHDRGRTSVWNPADLVAVARSRGSLTAMEAAGVLYDSEKPSPNEREKARRKLNALTEKGVLRLLDAGDKSTNRPASWGAA